MAVAAEIKRAYRRLAKEYHPDSGMAGNGEDYSTRFANIVQAYDLLSDPGRRTRYDRDNPAAAAQKSQMFSEHTKAKGFAFMERLGRAAAQVFAAPSEATRVHLKIAFMEAIHGARKPIRMSDGRRLDVQIPAGVMGGQEIRLAGLGPSKPDQSPPGDLVIVIEVEEHLFFTRQGLDIALDLPVGLDEAILGAKIPVPSLKGPVTLTIPAGANSGTVLRLKGKGIKAGRQRGDMLVRLEVRLPETVDEDLRDFLRGWRKQHGYNPRQDLPVRN